VLNDTGDQDLCYFNFLCAHPLGDLTDFNHVYSNLGYVLLGLLFIINTARRDVLRRQAQANHDRLEFGKDFGVFKRIYMVFWNDFQAGPSNWFTPMYVDRMFLLVIGILTNVGLVVYGLMERPPDFASYMLAIFITNLMLYTTFYIS
ncbi:hypothetical protein DAPPUDRAFT_119507, partial [Daphnia pulex]